MALTPAEAIEVLERLSVEQDIRWEREARIEDQEILAKSDLAISKIVAEGTLHKLNVFGMMRQCR